MSLGRAWLKRYARHYQVSGMALPVVGPVPKQACFIIWRFATPHVRGAIAVERPDWARTAAQCHTNSLLSLEHKTLWPSG